MSVKPYSFARARGHQHLAGVSEHIRIGGEGGDGPSDELRRLGIGQVEPLLRPP